jgi:hypothetical protein
MRGSKIIGSTDIIDAFMVSLRSSIDEARTDDPAEIKWPFLINLLRGSTDTRVTRALSNRGSNRGICKI